MLNEGTNFNYLLGLMLDPSTPLLFLSLSDILSDLLSCGIPSLDL